VSMYQIDWQKVGERLQELQKALNIKSSRQFALALDINGKTGDPSYMAKAEKGSTLSDSYITAIETKFNVNADWLKTGHGEMFGKSPKKVPHGTSRVNEDQADYAWKDKYIAVIEKEKERLEKENERLENNLELSLGELRHNILLSRAIAETTQELIVEYLEKGNKKKIVELIDTVGTKNLERYQKLKEEGNFAYVGK